MAFQLDKINLRQIRVPLKSYFETSFGRTYERTMILVEVVSDGLSGWGEVTAGENPFYNEEWTDASWLILKDYVAPRVLHTPFETANDVGPRVQKLEREWAQYFGVKHASSVNSATSGRCAAVGAAGVGIGVIGSIGIGVGVPQPIPGCGI